MSTKIEWTEETWNPIIGCSKISPGCDNCYAERMAGRLANISSQVENYGHVVKWQDDEDPHEIKALPKWNGKTHLVESALEKPLHWKKPRTIFVCSMGDLFHESVWFGWITSVLEVIQKCPQHTFMVLTKRPERMKEYFDRLDNVMQHGVCSIDFLPLKNVWLGVTAENQEQANKRIPILMRLPAAKRFISIEPMLGPIHLAEDWLYRHSSPSIHNLDWVICGGESGPGARPMHPRWVFSIRDKCQRAKVPFFFKQWGEWGPVVFGESLGSVQFGEWIKVGLTGAYFDKGRMSNPDVYGHRHAMAKVGKKKTGHLLDGQEWRQKP